MSRTKCTQKRCHCAPGEVPGLGLELGERVGRQALGAQLGLDECGEGAADRAEIGDLNRRSEYREQRAGVGEQEAFLPGDPEQVQVPVVFCWSELAEGDVAAE
jgi:hypothetical protein